ncbi:MAG TPA: ABC transporter substrate-binding protein [Candidatus Binatia bacterium]|nr:ABC transporter substrate-binding protein [Candidatus Binatia bacterium]
MNRLTRAVAAGLSVFVLALCSSSASAQQQPQPYRIGAILSYSGPSAPLGLPQVNGLKMAESEINAHGGINGRPIHFEIVDDEAKADVASQLATQQISSGVSIILCGTRVDTSGAVARVTAQAGMLQMIMVPTQSIWNAKNGVVKTIFQSQASDQISAQALLAFGKTKLGLKKVAIIHDANFFGTNGAEIATGTAKDHGIAVLGSEAYAGDATDFTPQIQRLMATNPDAIVMWGATTTPALVVKQFRQLGYTKPILSSGGIDSEAFLRIAGPADAGVYSIGALSKNHPSPEQKAFEDLYLATYKTPAVTFAAQTWDAATIVAAALKGTNGKTDGKSLSDYLEKGGPIKGVMATYRFSPKDHNGMTIDSVHVIVPNGLVWTDAPK